MKQLTGEISKTDIISNYDCFAFVMSNGEVILMEKSYTDTDRHIYVYLQYYTSGSVDTVVVSPDDTFEKRFGFYIGREAVEIYRAIISRANCDVEYGIIK